MKVAVLTLTRDRLDYTKHCFQRLNEFAGCDYDHYVLDQGSTDGTQEWLFETTDAGADSRDRFKYVQLLDENVGISRGLNILLANAPNYDVYVKFDNDCELTEPGTLEVACRVAMDNPFIVSPQIKGLNSPPAIESYGRVWLFAPGTNDGYEHRIGYVGQIGGIFMAIPAWVFDEFSYDEQGNPKWGMDDVQLSQWFRNRNGKLAYLLDYPANHYLTTVGQEADQPVYFGRKFAEMGLAL